MNKNHKFFAICIIILLMLASAVPVLAFDGREGDVVEIKADEVIDDDLYVGANQFTLDGTVKGDLFVGGDTIIINGTVEGDLFAAGNTIIVNGEVWDDARIAGAALQLGENANIGDDLLAAGASLETRPGSIVNGDLLLGGAQGLLAGNVTGDSMIGAGALELQGQFEGNVRAEVGDQEDGSPPPSMYMSNTAIPVPSVRPGLNIGSEARIEGNFEYVQTNNLTIPESVVGGKVIHNLPVVKSNPAEPEPTAAQKIGDWFLDLIRYIITLILFGLLLVWVMPSFMNSLVDKVKGQPAASFGWGIVAYAAFYFTMILILAIMIISGIIFGAATLGTVSGTIIWTGIILMIVMILLFVLATAFLTKIVVGWLGGKWLLGRFNPALADHMVWPVILGVVLIGIFVKIPYVGWLISLLIMFLGLGALWIWGRERLKKQAVEPQAS